MAYVMIVDDDEDFALAVAKVLQHTGYEVGIELDPQNALTNMQQRRPDLVILDVMFPEDASAGFELARTIRHHNEKVKGIPILMLTAVNQKFPLGFSTHDIDEYWMPVADFLEKPVDFDVLRNKVSALLHKAEPRPNRADKDL